MANPPQSAPEGPIGIAAPPPHEALQFDRADAPAQGCALCSGPLDGVYYTANQQVICTGCSEALASSLTGGSGLKRFVMALLLGVGGGLAGALL